MKRDRVAAASTAVFAAALLAGGANAQLSPDRLYYGVNRSIPMTVTVPEGIPGEVEIGLYRLGEADPLERASAEAGRVDLAGLFPVLWTTRDPKLMYAQLIVAGKQVGAPVVLQPLLSPITATARGREIGWQRPPSRVYSGLRAWSDRHVVLETTLGEVEIALRPDKAPNTAFHFLNLVEGGFYTDVIFHRIVPATGNGHPFVVQGGDPTGRGDGGPGVFIDLEESDLPHDFGVISMARTSDPNTNGSQFFLCLSREGTSFLDGNYTAFGATVRGADTIVALSHVTLADEQAGRPAEPPVILRAWTIPAPPIDERPEPVTRPPAGGASPR